METIRQLQEVKTNPPSLTEQPLRSENTTVEALLNMVQLAVSYVLLEDAIAALSDTHPNVSRIMPHLNSLVKERVMAVPGSDECLHKKRLQNVLESYQLDTIDVPKDGDCLFTSIAMYIEQLHTDQESSLIHHLQDTGIYPSTSRSGLILYLRELLVHEWLHNAGEYEPFFVGVVPDFEAECQKYLESGVFCSALGDTMLLGLSNVLRLPIVVFTSAESRPYFTVNPRIVPVHSFPLLLTFLQADSGHYSLAVRRPLHQSPPPTSVTTSHKGEEAIQTQSCHCGRGRNLSLTERQNCSKSSHYSSRCPCLRIKIPCTSKCSCKNCDNPFGCNSSTQQILKQDKGKARRKRPRHKEQDLGRCTSIKFMKLSDEQPLCGRWTRTEHYVLLAILQCMFHNKEYCNLDQLEIDQISDIYCDAVEVVVNNNILISLAPKSPIQIKAKLQQCMKEEQLLKECGSVNILPT